MLRKILTYTLRGLLGFFGLLLLISVAVYLPGVQRLVIGKAASYVQRNLGMKLSIERFRLTFPLKLGIDNTLLVNAGGDTLLRCGSLDAQVALWPLLRGEVRVVEFTLAETAVDYRDTTTGMALRADIGSLVLDGARARLKERSADIRRATLDRGTVDLSLEDSHPTDTTAGDTASVGWKIRASALELNAVVFHMHTHPVRTELAVDLAQGSVSDAQVDLGTQHVAVQRIRLVNGDYRYLSDAGQKAAPPAADTASGTPSPPWTVSLERLELADNSAAYGSLSTEPAKGFDPAHIRISALNLRIDSIRNRGADIAARIRELSLRERSGLEVTGAEGIFSMDSARISLRDFSLTTPDSRISAQAEAGGSIRSMQPDAPLSLTLEASLAASDLLLLYPANEALRRTLRGRSLDISAKLGGSLGQIDLNTLSLGIPRHIALRLSGQLRSVTAPDRLGGNLRLYGSFTRIDFLKELLPDTTLRNRLAFPERMTLRGDIRLAGQTYEPSLSLEIDTARLNLGGRVNLRNQSYQADLSALDFPLDAFLPQDSLGSLSMQLTARGRGFDPRKEGAKTDIGLDIDRFEYNGYRYSDLSVKAALNEHQLNGRISSASEALQFDLALDGQLRADDYAARLQGRVGRLDLYALHLTRETLHTSFYLETEVAARPDSAVYRAGVVLDSVRIHHGFHTDAIRRTALTASADRRQVTATVRSGDLSLDFKAFVPVDSLSGYVNRTVAGISRQIDSANLDMALIQEVLPPFRLEAAAGKGNMLYNLMKAKQMSFEQLNVSIATDSTAPFHGSVVINGLEAAGMTLDTLNIGLLRKEKRLDYFLRLANRPGNLEQMALIAVYGDVVGKGARINFFQRNRSDSVGFRFGLDARLQDSALRLSLFPLNPIFGYETWQANAGNYILMHRNKKLYADLRLEHGGQHVRLLPAQLPHLSDGAVTLDISGIDIASALQLLPAPPPVGGRLSTNLSLGMDQNVIAAKGTLDVDSLQYDKQRVGDIGLQLAFLSDSLQRRLLDASLRIDAKTVLTAKGAYLSAQPDPLKFTVALPGFPLSTLNPFLPADAARLAGTLQGEIKVTGSPQQLGLNGQLGFTDGQLSVPMIGTSFGLATSTLTIADNQVTFHQFGLTAPGGKTLTIDGQVDLSDFSQLYTDLRVRASDFPLVNAPRNSESMVYGKANADIDLSAKGRLNNLVVRGNVRLLNSTNVVYTLRDSPLQTRDEQQHIVTFVSFSDSTALARLDSVPPVQIWGMDMLVNVNIDDNVKATVNLSDDGNNRIALIGEGNLTFTMNPQGDTRFTGRYTLSGGTVVYNPPVISQKVFSINTSSYVEWTGDIADPSFNITATESVQTTVTSEDNSSRKVTFDISVNVRNTLKDLSITFDLAAPSDLAIQNQLLSLAPEQRSTQAMALLIYNTYTGPGTTAKIDSNNPLNSFIEKELNQWARNNLKNVDVSFGIKSVNDPSSAAGQHTDYSYKVSKNLFNDRVKVTVGGSISSDADPTQNMKENFVDDISLEYRLNKRDNMSLKVYRYNTQESILEGEVIDTGVGFVVRKKLNRLGDLFRLSGNPEKKKQREQKKALKANLKQKRETPSPETPSPAGAAPETTPTHE